jgi:hypothetical protein
VNIHEDPVKRNHPDVSVSATRIGQTRE